MWQTLRRDGMGWDTKSLSAAHHLQLERALDHFLPSTHPTPEPHPSPVHAL